MDTTGTTPESNFTAAAKSTIALYSDLATGNGRIHERDRRFKRITKKPQRYVLSALGSLANRKSFASVETLCLFIGYPRSGHSLIGALLDAHPNAIIADELDALKYVQAGFSRNQLFYLLLRGSRQSASAGRQRTGYSYHVPGQWQGRFEELRVIGDKMGHASAIRLGAFPSLFDTLANGFNVKIKFLHVMRNPYDVISTMALRTKLSLASSCDLFFSSAEAVELIKQRSGETAVHDLRHEDFVANPKSALKAICAFLNLKEDDDYFDACARIVYQFPHKSRQKISWSPNLIDSVKQRMSRFSFLQDYSFDV